MFCNIDQRSNLFHADIEYAKIVLIYCLIVRLFSLFWSYPCEQIV